MKRVIGRLLSWPKRSVQTGFRCGKGLPWQRAASLALAVAFFLALFPGLPIDLTKKVDAGSVLSLNSTSAATAGGGTSLVINKPSGVTSGDVMIAMVSISNSTQAITPPGGGSAWTSIDSNTRSAGGGGGFDVKVEAFYRVAGGSEPSSYTWTISSSVSMSGGITNYRGVDTTSPINISGGKNTGQNSPASTGTMTTTVNNAKIIAGYGASVNIGGNTISFTAVNGNEQFDVCSTGLLNNAATELTDYTLPAAGPTSASSSTTTGGNSNWASLQVALTPDTSTIHMMLLWDGGGAAPTGWSYLTDAEGRYLRGDSAANYGLTGGHATHTHDDTTSVTHSGPSATNTNLGLSVATSTENHTHTLGTVTVGAAVSNEPAGYKLRLIRYDAGVPNVIPNGGIAIFDADPGMPGDGHWTRLSAADNRVIKIDSSVGNGPGSDTHTHTLTWPALGAATGGTNNDCLLCGGGTQGASGTHTHAAPSSGPSATATQIPPYFQPVLAKVDQDTPTISLGITAMFDGDPGGGWVIRSNSGGTYYHKFMRPGVTFDGVGGGTDGHKIPDTTAVSGPAIGTSGNGNGTNGTARAAHTHTLTATWPAYTSDSHYVSDSEYFLPPYFSVVIAEKVNFILNAYYWYYDNGTVTPTDKWGNPDISISSPITTLPIVSKDPPKIGDDLRLRIQILINGNNLAASSVTFKMQFNATRSSSCTTANGAWTDVAASGTTTGGTLWRYTSSTAVSDNSLIAALPGGAVFTSPATTVRGHYIRSNNAGVNTNSATIGDYIEYDFHINDFDAAGATQYSFRVLEANGTLLSQYSVCPTLTTKPRTENLLRHGNFFNADQAGDGTGSLENGFSWAN